MADKKKQKVSKLDIPTLNFGSEDAESVTDTYCPEGFEDVEDYLQDMRESYEADLDADDDNRKAALEDKKFVAGEQWDPQVLQQRAGLPCLSLNTIPQFTAQLVGDWRENKVSVKVLPAENGDKDTADIRADLIRSIETRSRADRVYDDAFESMVQCGDGAFRVGVQYTSDTVFDQDIVVQPIDDALSVIWDRMSIDPTARDARHCFVEDRIPLKEFNDKWPEANPSGLGGEVRRSMSTTGWIDDKSARVLEHWRVLERKKMIAMYEDGSMHSLDETDYPTQDKLNEKLDDLHFNHGKMVKTRLAPCRYVQMHLVTGYQILSGPYEWKLNRLPIIRMSGRTVVMGERRVRYGLVRFMKDAVRLRNFWRSIAAEQLGYAPKAQWIAPESAVEGREDEFRRAHLSRNPLLVYNDDASAPPERIEPPQIQAALLNEAQVNNQDIKDITGIQDASLGIKSNETSGKAIMARQREGDVASITYYDNGNAALLEAGDVMNQLIGQIYDGTRIIRIIGEDEATKMVNINDPADPASPNLAVGQYDVAMSTGASYTTRRQEAAEAMMNAIQVYPELMQTAGDLIVKAQDWPGAEELSERLQKTIPPQLLSDKEKQEMGNQPDINGMMQQQAQQQEQMQQMGQQFQQMQQENQMLKVKDAAKTQQHSLDAYKAETDRLLAYAAILKDNQSLNLQALEQEADAALTGHKIVADHLQATNDQQMAADQQAHNQKLDIANLLQGQVQHQSTQDNANAQAEASRQHQAQESDANRQAAAKQAKATPAKKGSTPPSK